MGNIRVGKGLSALIPDLKKKKAKEPKDIFEKPTVPEKKTHQEKGHESNIDPDEEIESEIRSEMGDIISRFDRIIKGEEVFDDLPDESSINVDEISEDTIEEASREIEKEKATELDHFRIEMEKRFEKNLDNRNVPEKRQEETQKAWQKTSEGAAGKKPVEAHDESDKHLPMPKIILPGNISKDTHKDDRPKKRNIDVEISSSKTKDEMVKPPQPDIRTAKKEAKPAEPATVDVSKSTVYHPTNKEVVPAEPEKADAPKQDDPSIQSEPVEKTSEDIQQTPKGPDPEMEELRAVIQYYANLGFNVRELSDIIKNDPENAPSRFEDFIGMAEEATLLINRLDALTDPDITDLRDMLKTQLRDPSTASGMVQDVEALEFAQKQNDVFRRFSPEIATLRDQGFNTDRLELQLSENPTKFPEIFDDYVQKMETLLQLQVLYNELVDTGMGPQLSHLAPMFKDPYYIPQIQKALSDASASDDHASELDQVPQSQVQDTSVVQTDESKDQEGELASFLAHLDELAQQGVSVERVRKMAQMDLEGARAYLEKVLTLKKK